MVVELLPNRIVLVETEHGERIQAHLSGAARIGVIRLVAGDPVQIQRSPFDRTKARIVPVPRTPPGSGPLRRPLG